MPNWIRITRFELVLVSAAILAMAAIVLPVSRCELEDAYESIAADDLQRWGEAVHAYLLDQGADELPPLLKGPGTLPSGLEHLGEAGSLEALLHGRRSGPEAGRMYLRHFSADPWGRSFVVITAPAVPRHACWILSAGRNGRLETDARSNVPAGDDLGLHLR